MKSAYFWIQLQSRNQHNSKQIHRPLNASESVVLETNRSTLLERFNTRIKSAIERYLAFR